MIFGLGAAVGWGVADFLAAISSRRIGSVGAVVVSQTVGLAGYAVLFATTGVAFDVSAFDVIVMLCSGAVAAGAYFALYRGLELGPITLVSPIGSAFALVTILLAVVLAGESLRGAVLAGVVVTLAGVFLTSTDLRRLGADVRRHWGGIPFGLLAMVGFGVVAFITGRYAQEVGWLLPIFIVRAGSVAVVVTVAVRRGGPVVRGMGVGDLALITVVGVADLLGIAMYSMGSERGLISIVAAASAAFTLIPVAGGLVFFGERPAPNQGLGVAAVVGGLLLLGIATG